MGSTIIKSFEEKYRRIHNWNGQKIFNKWKSDRKLSIIIYHLRNKNKEIKLTWAIDIKGEYEKEWINDWLENGITTGDNNIVQKIKEIW